MSASVLAQSTSIAINNLRGFSSSFDSNVVTIFRDFVGDAVSISTTLGSLNLTTANTSNWTIGAAATIVDRPGKQRARAVKKTFKEAKDW